MAFGITAFAESPFAATGSQSINVAVTGQELTIAETSPDVVISVVEARQPNHGHQEV